MEKRSAEGYLGAADEWQVVFSGLQDKPDLAVRLRAYRSAPFADIQVTVRNTTDKSVDVQAMRSVDASGNDAPPWTGPPTEDRVLSDSFSEDRPAMQIHDLGDAGARHAPRRRQPAHL